MIDKTMIVIRASWNGNKSFKLIPVSKECPYNECIFDPEARLLAIVSKEYKRNVQTLPEITQGTKFFKSERVIMDTYYEYFIEDKEEIKNFINYMSQNYPKDMVDSIENAFKEVDVT